MNRKPCPPTGPTVVAFFICIWVLTSGLAYAGTDGICISVQVPEPIRLPDGKIHPAGNLTLCDSVSFSPVSTLHETFVNGRPVGMFRSRRSKSEGPAGRSPQVMFRSDGTGHLALVGYVLPDTVHNVAFQLEATRKKTRRQPTVEVASASGGSGQGLTMLAATFP